ncbi:Hypothetical protein NTJ_07171 [Nesidiocoris tenuis]|uniref:Uncharacterized protein n=1 Tax=Nesidiocoris tenuis TaxID=355587 RepID=A0ABN7AQ79_9HEMI|nr:Hypothetical protein NTJ_07171 [Nesidiocoris tenuis]
MRGWDEIGGRIRIFPIPVDPTETKHQPGAFPVGPMENGYSNETHDVKASSVSPSWSGRGFPPSLAISFYRIH